MNDLNQSQGIHREGIIVIVFFIGLAFTAVLTFTLAQQTQAGSDCSGNSWSVGNEADLNAAVACYNSQTTADEYTIAFTQNISLTASTTAISNTASGVALIVEGAGFTIDGQGIEGVRPLTINSDTHVYIQNSTIIRGYASTSGGGILNSGILTVSNTIISGNSAPNQGSGGRGGGIYSTNILVINNSIISNNFAALGGGINIFAHSTFRVSNSTISENSAIDGGGIQSEGSGTISKSTIRGNSSSNKGGGIHTTNDILTITNSTINNNSTRSSDGGGIFNGGSGTININSTTLSGNSSGEYGGGIYNSHILNISNSTINGNSTDVRGGAVYNNGIGTINNSTISSNSAIQGGGIFNYGTLTVGDSTISDNTATNLGGGIYIYFSSLIIRNSIIANSINGGDCYNNSGTNPRNDNRHNLVEDNSCGFTGGSDPMLGSLQDNGGSTFTHALLPGSPAIDAGNTTLTHDQRGFPRPVGSADDIGAFEVFNISDFVYLPMIQNQQ